MKVLLTGGAGYIGSHTAIELLTSGYEVVIVDNLRNSKASVVDRISEISGLSPAFYELDVADYAAMDTVLKQEQPDAVIHFAGLKAVGESVADPLLYYQLNLLTSISLCRAMADNNVTSLVFSSSATVYGEPEQIALDENCNATRAVNPYGRTKVIIEQMLRDLCDANPELNVVRLRYFNPAGAHPSARLGEDPKGVPNNLVPFLTQVAAGLRNELVINGDDYPTEDGTCIRDYIHVQDLARGHVAAIRKLQSNCRLVTYNLGTGIGHSVKEVVAAFELATNQHLPRTIGPRREGDVPAYYTDPSLAERELGWKTELTIEDICRDAWQWQAENPTGYP
jgi:UDP-glucose 4-epimerase|tara:strand:+ start:122 stop:1135 length:1014 start_codon:yes stop_codon:yes gene_type:complete